MNASRLMFKVRGIINRSFRGEMTHSDALRAIDSTIDKYEAELPDNDDDGDDEDGDSEGGGALDTVLDMIPDDWSDD